VVLRTWFRIRFTGAEYIPADGAAIIAPNHKNFLDPFFIGLATHRQVRFMAKAELLSGPLGWLFSRLGAFPVHRGQGDSQALATAREILGAGGLVVLFPEGTRVEEPDALGSPHHGAGRLALETGAPVIPAAITGTAHLWRGAIPKLKRVQLTFLPPIEPGVRSPDEARAATELIDDRVWPAVLAEYGRLRARPGLIAAGLAAIGFGGLLTRRQLEARRQPRLLGRIEPRRMRRARSRRRLLGRLWPRRLPHPRARRRRRKRLWPRR
jgi:1-acyl-sn-glycerol-3-phosphate acyltransferase